MSGVRIVFDTHCVLCSGFVYFILRHERDTGIVFVNAWSEEGLELAARHGLTEDMLHETYLVVRDGEGFVRSDAGFVVVSQLKAPWRWLGVLRVVPRPLRDRVYSLIARRRYKWFGYREQCMVPTAETRHRFVGI